MNIVQVIPTIPREKAADVVACWTDRKQIENIFLANQNMRD